MRLDLVCSDCDEENTFEVSRIYMSLDDPGAGPYIGDDLTCPSCDAEGPFEITPRGQMSLTAEVLKITASAKRGGEQKSPLEFVDTQLADGTVMAPGAAVRHYHDRVRSDPGSVVDLLSLANLYRNLGPERLAVDYYERCLQLEPGCAEAARSLSSMRMEEGRFEDAWPVLQRAWMHRDRWKLYRLLEASPQQFESVFVGQYDDVARKLGHPMIQPAERRRVDIEIVAPSRHGSGKRRKKRKIGRNQPCPCGSGKKYKRCCLGKDRG